MDAKTLYRYLWNSVQFSQKKCPKKNDETIYLFSKIFGKNGISPKM